METETVQVSRSQAQQLSAGPASKIEQRTSTEVRVEQHEKGAAVVVTGTKTGVAKALTMLKVLVAFKEAASPEERGICHWFSCGFCREGKEGEDGCEAGLHCSKIIADTEAGWVAKTPSEMPKVNVRPLLLVISCGGAPPPTPPSGAMPGVSGPRYCGGGIGCPEEDLLELCLVAVDWAEGCEVSRFHRFIRPSMWEQQLPQLRQNYPAECINEQPTAMAWKDALADVLDWLPKMLSVSMDEMNSEDILLVSPRDFEAQSLLPRRCGLGDVDHSLQDFFFRRWCCLKDVFREHFALPNEAAPTGLGSMARYLGLPPVDKVRRTYCMDENGLVLRVVLELLKKGWKPKATAWRDAAHSPTTFLLPRRGDLDEQHSRKRNFWETEAPPAPPAVVPKLSPAAKIVGAVAKVAPKPTPPWQMAPPPPPPAAPVEPMAAAEEGEWAPEGDGEEVQAWVAEPVEAPDDDVAELAHVAELPPEEQLAALTALSTALSEQLNETMEPEE